MNSILPGADDGTPAQFPPWVPPAQWPNKNTKDGQNRSREIIDIVNLISNLILYFMLKSHIEYIQHIAIKIYFFLA